MTFKFRVTHSPDGGEEEPVAKFAHKRDALRYCKYLLDDPHNDIRRLDVYAGRKQTPIYRFGWATEC